MRITPPTSSSTSVLTVISGGTSASIDLSGHYTSASFHISAGIGETVEIIDPPLIGHQPGFGLPNTLGYIGHGLETVIGDILTGKIALMGNYIAAGFPAVTHGQGANLASEVPQAEQQPILAHPPHG